MILKVGLDPLYRTMLPATDPYKVNFMSPNDRPRVSQTKFTINGTNVTDTILYSEHKLESIIEINGTLQDTMHNYSMPGDTGILLITMIYYENDQMRIQVIE
jgi:hypothetical protein